MADLSLEQGLDVLAVRTRWVDIAVVTYIVASLATVAGQAGELLGVVDLDNSGDAPLLMLVGVVYLAFAAITIATMVLVAMWIYRAHANVRSAGIGQLEISPGWAVGWFFVPIANLFKPFQAMRQLWNASHNQADSFSQESNPTLNLWWGFWIVSNIVTNISARSMFSGGPAGQSTTTVLDVIGGLLSIPAAWFLWQIVREVNAAQRSTLGTASAFA